MLAVGDFQGTSVMNYADDDVPYTRITSSATSTRSGLTRPTRPSIMREFSRFAEQAATSRTTRSTPPRTASGCSTYRDLAAAEEDVLFGGRLGTYKYLDMHMAIGSALTMFDNKIRPHFEDGVTLESGGVDA